MMRSIRSKLIVLMVAVTAVILLIGFSVVVAGDVVSFRKEMVTNTVLMARVIGEYSVGDLVFEDHEAATETLAKLAGVPLIEYAVLLNSVGGQVASYGFDAGVDRPGTDEPRYVVFEHGALHVLEPVVYQGEHFGSIYLRASTSELRQRIGRRILVVALLLVALLAVAAAMAIRVQGLISSPILDLAGTARRISETGNHSIRVDIRGSDEIGTLAESFNRMLDQIQLRQLERDEAMHRTREKSHFLAAMSHELRTPLNSIIGFSEILISRLHDRLEPKLASFLVNINSSGKHLLGIINDILDLSKVEAGKMALHTEPTALAMILEGVVAVMRGTTQKRGVEIIIESMDQLPVIEADPVKLKQVFFNLISNAVKFSPEQAQVRIVARTVPAAQSSLEEDAVEIDFVDRGIGIAQEDFEKIFQPFRQADSGISRRFGGTGLGLSLVRSYVKKHRGDVRLSSTVGEGSTFTVILPVRSGGAPAAERERSSRAGTLGRQSILVVEDDRRTLDRIRSELEKVGLEVFPASSGEQALALVQQIRPAAIVLDLVLPGIDGWAVLKAVKSSPYTAGIPVVICSELGNEQLAVALGADDYFLKSQGIGDLAQRVSSLLSGGERAKPARVLVIDDDPQFHDQIEAHLVPMGFRLEHASSGREGADLAVSEPPDLIILDLLMDGMDGFDVALELQSRAETAELPIVVLTAAELTMEDRERLHGKIAAAIRKGDEERRTLARVVTELLHRQTAD